MSVRTFSFPHIDRVVHGPGAVNRVPALLDEVGAARVVLVTNRSLATTTPLVDTLMGALGSRLVATFPTMGAHAPATDVDAATALAREVRADAFVAFGGSSVTDATKIVALHLDGRPQVHVPTTLSAGEYTPASGMTGEVPGVKTYVADARMAPWAVVLDPEVTLHTPAELWASTGVKSLDHAAEAMWSSRAHPYSDVLATEAIRRLLVSLPATVARSDDLAAREDCQVASWMSMAGVMTSGVGLSHVLGHQIGARWHVPHGVTSCITLPHVMRFLGPAADRVAVLVGGPNGLTEFIAGLGLPTRLRDVGAREEDFKAVAEAALPVVEMWRVEVPGGVATLVELLERMW